MSKKSNPDPKIQLTEYSMSVHMGICHGPVDKVHQIRIGEKIAYGTTPERISAGGQDLSIAQTTTLSISKPNLHGGERKEGGAVGRAWVRFGDADQTTPSLLASKLGRTTETTPGFRGLLTAWFTGSGSGGFIWGHNTPYLKPVGFRVERVSGLDWYPETARIYRELPNRVSLYMSIDRSSSMTAERQEAVKEGLGRVFDFIETAITSFGVDIDIAVQFWGTTSTVEGYTSATLANISSLRSFVADFNSFDESTDFTIAAQGAVDWFEDTVGDSTIDKRVWVFLTDGGPSPPGSGSSIDPDNADDAEAIAADLLDRASGDFSTAADTAVDCHGVNLVEPDSQYTAQLDNTPTDGVPVITAEQSSALTAIIVSALGIGAVDANPAHMIRECLLNQNWGMGGAASSLDDDSFRAGADTLFAERFGLSMQWAQQSTIETFVDEIKDHIQGHVNQHPGTGLLTLKLIRGDYDVEDLPVISPDNAKLSNWQRKGLGETINEIIVRYTDPESGKPESVAVQDLALISTQGLVSETRDYLGVRRRDLAIEIAHRDLSVARAPLATCDAVLDRTMWELVPGDVVKLTWPEHGIVQQVFRVAPVDEGGPGDSDIKVSLAEDVFGLDQGDFTTPPGSEWEDPSEEPTAIDHHEFLTVLYWTVVKVGGAAAAQAAVHPESAVGVLAAQGGSDTSQYDLLTEVIGASGASTFETVATRPILSRMELADELSAEAESTIALGSRTQGDGPAVGGFVWIGTGGDLAMELALVTAVTDDDVTVKRGVLDTVPVAWPAATPVWFLNANLPWHDPSERSAGEMAEYKILPHTSLGLFEEADAAILQFTVGERPHLPSRPANVKVEGVGFGIVDCTAADPIDVTISERNRLTEDSQVLAWDDATVTPESGQTWKVELLAPSDRTLIAAVDSLTGTSTTIAHSVFDGNSAAILRMTAERDGFESLQGHEITAVITGPAISGTPVTTAEVDVAYDGFTVSATGGLPPYAFSVTAGALPPGITLDPVTGVVAGTATEEDVFSGIVITVTDAAGLTDDLDAFTITVGAAVVDWHPTDSAATIEHWEYDTGLGTYDDGDVVTWKGAIGALGLIQHRVARHPTGGASGAEFAGGAAGQSLTSIPLDTGSAPTVASTSTFTLPDAQASDVGKGFSITGLTWDESRGVWWAMNWGLPSTSLGGTPAPSLVKMDADFALLDEIDLTGVISQPQGVAVDTSDGSLWIASPDDDKIYNFNPDTEAVVTSITVTTPNGVGYDASDDTLIYTPSGGANSHKISKAGVVQWTLPYGGTDSVDHVHVDSENGCFYRTVDGNVTGTSNIQVATTDGASGVLSYLVPANMFRVEGIAAKGTDLYVAVNSYAHGDGGVNNVHLIPGHRVPKGVTTGTGGSPTKFGVMFVGRGAIPGGQITNPIWCFGSPVGDVGVGLYAVAADTTILRLFVNTAAGTAERAFVDFTVPSGYGTTAVGIVHVHVDTVAETAEIRFNGGAAESLAIAAISGTIPLADLQIMEDLTRTGNTVAGELRTITPYSGDLTDAERQKFEGYLAHETGTEGLLDGAHPYKSAPPEA